MRDELRGVSGGRKQLYLHVHRSEIIDFYVAHGYFETMQEFNLQIDTLEKFLRDNIKNDKKPKSPGPDRDKLMARLEIAEDAVRALAGQQRKLIGDFQNFVPSVANTIAQKYIIPGIVNGLMQTLSGKDTPLPENDPLKLGENEAENQKIYVMLNKDENEE